jgi:multidrug efflux pump subunit AcrA (membrane-fusion protein)
VTIVNDVEVPGEMAPPPKPKGSKGKRIGAAVAVVIVVAAAGTWVAISNRHKASGATPPTATTKEVVAVTTGSISNTVSAEGTVAAAATDDLNFGAAGTVTAVNVKVGDSVKKGQTVATMTSPSLTSNLVAAGAAHDQAAAKLADDQAAGASSEQIAADNSSLAVAEDNLTKAWAAAAGASLISTIDGTVTAMNLTVGEQLSSSGSGGTSATGSASGSGASSANLGKSGQGNNGSSNQSSSSPQVEVVSSGQYTVTLNVGTSDITNVAAGQNVTLSISNTGSSSTGNGFGGGGAFFGGPGGFSGFGGNATQRAGGNGQNGSGGSGTSQRTSGGTQAAATGTVTTVSKIATASSGVATYPVTVSFTGDPTKVFVGATATASITTGERSGVLLVPTRAITTTNGVSTVTVALDGTVGGRTETRTVQTGETSNGMVEVTSGLSDGDKVIVEVPAAFANATGAGGFTGTRGGGGTGGSGGAGGSGGFPPGGFQGGGFGG